MGDVVWQEEFDALSLKAQERIPERSKDCPYFPERNAIRLNLINLI